MTDETSDMECITCISYVRNATREELMSTFRYSYPDELVWDDEEQAWKVTFNALSNENAWYSQSDDDARGKLPKAKFKQVYYSGDGSILESIDYMDNEEFEKYLNEELKKMGVKE